jgi:hypothetical protein
VCFTKTFSFTSPEKDFFFYIHGVISSPEKEKRSVLYYSDISDMFPVTGGNFIHTCMHVHIVFAGVRVCVRAGRRVCVCVKQIHTYSSRELPSVAAGAGSGARLRCQTRELPSVAAGAGSGARLRCQTRELPSVAAGALSRACDICTHVITHNSLQVSTSLYIKMTLLRALVIKIIGMYVCMYVGTYIYITPQVSPPIIFAMEKRWEKIKNIFPTSQERHTKCVRACGRYIRS